LPVSYSVQFIYRIVSHDEDHENTAKTRELQTLH